ncbi:hypothetical protein [Nostoc sp.]
MTIWLLLISRVQRSHSSSNSLKERSLATWESQPSASDLPTTLMFATSPIKTSGDVPPPIPRLNPASPPSDLTPTLSGAVPSFVEAFANESLPPSFINVFYCIWHSLSLYIRERHYRTT